MQFYLFLFYIFLFFSPMQCRQQAGEKAVEKGRDAVYASVGYQASEGAKYALKTSNTATSAAQLYDVTQRNTKALLRFDYPHGKTSFNHINVNPKLSGLKSDPHIPLPPGGAYVSGKVASTLKVVNKVLTPVAIGLAVIDVFGAAEADSRNGNKDHYHKTQAVARIGGAYIGGSYGSSIGASLGTMVMPGVGTLFGGLVGGLIGAIGAGEVTTTVVDGFVYNK